MAVIEALLITGLIAWGIASFGYAFRVRGLHGLLRRGNVFTAYVHWTMFNVQPTDDADRAATLQIEYRDMDAGGEGGPHQVVSTAFASGWRGFFWMPERRVALHLQSVAATVKAAAESGAPPEGPSSAGMRLLKAYLCVVHPLAPGARREIRVVERNGVPVMRPGSTATGGSQETVLASLRHEC